jgi:hypothetical protein
MNKAIVYIPLLDEGTPVWRPTEAEEVSDLTFMVLPTANYNPDDEHWAFPPGTIVRCIYEVRSGNTVLVAIEKA